MSAQGMIWTLIIVIFLRFANGQLRFGIGQVEYMGDENAEVTIEVIKSGANVGDLYINVAPLTYAQLESMAIPIPPDVPGPQTRPDPAEFEVSGKQDFNNAALQVVFPATTSVQQVQQNMTIPFINDGINEDTEGLYILATVDRVLSDSTDVQEASAIRNGVALIRINDDDEIGLTFEQLIYEVSESAGLVDNLIFVAKQDGRASEQILMINVLISFPNQNRGTRGPSSMPSDFSLPIVNITTSSFELEFEVMDTRLNISLDVFDDSLLESRTEAFFLTLSIPPNPANNLIIGSNSQTTVHILDNEVGRIGFRQTKYEVFENETSLEVCATIFEPSLANVSSEVDAFIFAETLEGTAQSGLDYRPLVAGSFDGDDVNLDHPNFQGCAQLILLNDDLVEGTETLQLSLVTDDAANGFINANFIFDPSVTEVCILDDDQSSTPSIAPSTVAAPTRVVQTPRPTMAPTAPTTTGMGGDPHYSILLPTGQLLCYSVHGEHDFVFNLISNKVLQMNALFVADARRKEVTWIGELGVVMKHRPRKRMNTTTLRFCAEKNMVCVGDKVKLQASGVERITFSQGKLSISKRSAGGDVSKPAVLVEFPDIGLSFTVTFVRGKHLDMTWNKVARNMADSHGMIGQFFRRGVEIDEARRLLVLPDMDPVPVMRKPVWHFMERESPDEQLCWVAMNPGYQGKKLLQGHYLDYLVNDVLSTDFKFKPRKHKKAYKTV